MRVEAGSMGAGAPRFFQPCAINRAPVQHFAFYCRLILALGHAIFFSRSVTS